MGKSLLVVYSDPASPELEQQYNDWYSDVHLADLLKVPGCVAARRYRLGPQLVVPGDAGPQRGYLAIYEIEGDIDAFRTEMGKLSPNWHIDPAMGLGNTSAVFWLAVAEGIA